MSGAASGIMRTEVCVAICGCSGSWPTPLGSLRTDQVEVTHCAHWRQTRRGSSGRTRVGALKTVRTRWRRAGRRRRTRTVMVVDGQKEKEDKKRGDHRGS